MQAALMASGWKCPGCGRTWAPHVDQCRICEPGAAPVVLRGEMTISELWELFEPWGRRHISSWRSIHATHKRHLIGLGPAWSVFGHLPWTEVTHARADEYVEQRLAQRTARGHRLIKPGTVNRELATLKAMINWGLGHRAGGPPPGQCPLNGDNPLENYPTLPESTARRFHLTEEQCMGFLESCPPMLQLIVIFAIATGMRRDEFRLLEWSEIRWEMGVIYLAPHRTKSRKERNVILRPMAVEVLNRLPRTSRYVFQNPQGGGKPIPKSTMGGWFVAAREACGIKGPKDQAVWMHTLRKTMATLAAMGGANIYMLMQHLGHTSKEVHDEYTQMSPDYYDGFRTMLEGQHPDPNRRLDPRPAPVAGQPSASGPEAQSPLWRFLRREEPIK